MAADLHPAQLRGVRYKEIGAGQDTGAGLLKCPDEASGLLDLSRRDTRGEEEAGCQAEREGQKGSAADPGESHPAADHCQKEEGCAEAGRPETGPGTNDASNDADAVDGTFQGKLVPNGVANDTTLDVWTPGLLRGSFRVGGIVQQFRYSSSRRYLLFLRGFIPGRENVRTILAGILVTALTVLFLSQSASAQIVTVKSLKDQLQTTVFHSGELAQRGTAIAATRTHLQHVINCLEGPTGANFVQAAGYPCQGQGNGALVDLRAAVTAGMKGAERALKFTNIAHTLALQAVRMNDVNEAQPWAMVISRQLQIAFNSI